MLCMYVGDMRVRATDSEQGCDFLTEKQICRKLQLKYRFKEIKP